MNGLVASSKMFLKRNSSTILTCVGAAGVVATTVMAVKATPKAMTLLEDKKEEKGEKLTAFETIRVAGPVYIPTIITGAATIACVFGANILNKRQQAVMTSAYALLNNSYQEYKAKVQELQGEEFDARVKGEIAKDNYEDADVISGGKEDTQLFYDFFSGQYFESTMEKVMRAEYNLNKMIVTQDYAYLNSFYDELGIDTIDPGWALGWSSVSNFNMYWQTWVDFKNEKVTLEDGLECVIITMDQEPIVGFEDYC